MTQPLLQAADLRGAARLTTDAVAGLTSLVEAMHARIAGAARASSSPGAAPPDEERTPGLTGLVYETVRGVTRVVGGTTERLLGWLGSALMESSSPHRRPRAEREAVLAALNGVLGDHLAATGNPLAITMTFRHGGRPLVPERFVMRSRLPDATPKLLLLLHGLCMNDLQWRRETSSDAAEAPASHDHGEMLARTLGYTPVYLHYNSGLSISTNGRILAQQLEHLYDAWPVPVQRFVMLGHSMGGLVARSAVHHGALLARGALRWPQRVDDLVCLGTPHHGVPLERLGHGVDVLLGAAPYAAPLARLGKLRSAGINDLRHGNVLAGPVGGALDDGAAARPAQVQLPAGTRCFALAAHLGPAGGNLKTRLLGDGLVPVRSALGLHDDAERRLAFAPERQAVVHETTHLGLLGSAEVAAQLEQWLR
jgi:pimeloyl-ACP methyl ester carboxylesterase